MSKFIEVARTTELPDGAMKALRVDGQEILLARTGNDYHAVDNRCPHLKAKLSDGKLEGTVVTCPAHGSQFNVRDGAVIRWTKWSGLKLAAVKLLKHPRPLTTYPVKVEGDKIRLKIH